MWRSAITAGRGRCRRLLGHSGRRLDLLERALTRRLVRTPSQQPGAVAEPAAAHVIVAHLADQLRAQRLPLAGTLSAPPARPPGPLAGQPARPAPRPHRPP